MCCTNVTISDTTIYNACYIIIIAHFYALAIQNMLGYVAIPTNSEATWVLFSGCYKIVKQPLNANIGHAVSLQRVNLQPFQYQASSITNPRY